MKYIKQINDVGEEIAELEAGLEFKKAYDENNLTDEQAEAFENGDIIKILDEDKASNRVAELKARQKKELKSLEQVLHKSSIGKKVFTLKQGQKVGVDEYGNDVYDGQDLQICVTDSSSIIGVDGTMLTFTIRGLKRRDVKAIQNLWKTVYQRGKARMLDGNKPNDYYMTLDCVTIDEHNKLMFTFGCYRTPLFCSSDGDDDLTLMFFTEECFIDISPYNKREVDYQATKLAEQGNVVNKHWMTEEESEEAEKQEVLHDVMYHPDILDDNGKNYS